MAMRRDAAWPGTTNSVACAAASRRAGRRERYCEMADVAHPAGGAHGADTSRRDFLTLTAAALGAVGAGSAIWPFIDSMNPAKDTLALATTEVDLGPVALGQRLTVVWRGKPVFIDHRPPEEVQKAADVKLT